MTEPLPVTGADRAREVLAHFSERDGHLDTAKILRSNAPLYASDGSLTCIDAMLAFASEPSTPSTGAVPEGMREALAQAAERAGCKEVPVAIRAGEPCLINTAIALDALAALVAPVPATREGWPAGAIDALTHGQEQADMHGERVKVSRQALDEVLTYLAAAPTSPSDIGDGWRTDMEAAPRDGTLILALWRDHRSLVYAIAHFRPKSGHWWDGNALCDRPPVYWQPMPPLPAAPTVAQGEGK